MRGSIAVPIQKKLCCSEYVLRKRVELRVEETVGGGAEIQEAKNSAPSGFLGGKTTSQSFP